MIKYAYTRVSTDKQDAQYQIELLVKAGVPRDNIFTDVMSGKLFDRPNFQKLNSLLRKGDKVYFTQLSRIGRKQRETIDWLVGEQDPPGLEKRGIKFYILNNKFLNTDEANMVPGIRRVVLELLGYLAEEEVQAKSFNTMHGMAHLKTQGMKAGRPPISEYKQNAIRTMRAANVPIKQIARDLGIARCTVQRYERDPAYSPTMPIRAPGNREVPKREPTDKQREASRRNGALGNPVRSNGLNGHADTVKSTEIEYAF